MAAAEERKCHTVSSVARRLTHYLEAATAAPAFWAQGELSGVRDRGDTIYFDLVETRSGQTLAKLNAQVWGSAVATVRGRFREVGLPTILEDGMQVGLFCKVRFHPVHGLSLAILDASAETTLGVLEARRRAVITTLRREHLLERNRNCPVSLLPKRVGVVASRETAAFADFVETLRSSGYGIQIVHADARVQGDATRPSVLRALDCLAQLAVDVVVIARGGGSRIDLAHLDDESIARKIASFPCAVWTAIGHETDESVLDLVAARSFKTPTAAAEHLVSLYAAVEEGLRSAALRMANIGRLRLARPREGLAAGKKQLQRAAVHRLTLAGGWVSTARREFSRAVKVPLLQRHEAWRQLALLLPRSVRACVDGARQQLAVHHKSLLKTGTRALDHEQTAGRYRRQRLAAGGAGQRLTWVGQRSDQLQSAFRAASRRAVRGLRERLHGFGERLRAPRAHITVRRGQLATHEKSLLKTAGRRLDRAREQRSQLGARFDLGRQLWHVDRLRDRLARYLQALAAPAARLKTRQTELATVSACIG